MIIRPAHAVDAEAIAAIHNAVIQDTLVTFTTETRTVDSVATDISNRPGQYLVVEQNEQVVGFAAQGPFRGGPGYAHSREHTIHLGSGLIKLAP